MKGIYGVVLLSAVALDDNNHLFPITHVIVENESKHIWSFFFWWHLKHTLNDGGRN